MIKWFKCSEISPPDDGKDYLTYNGNGFSVGVFMYEEEDLGYFFSGVGPIYDVTHWAYLPNPPKE